MLPDAVGCYGRRNETRCDGGIHLGVGGERGMAIFQINGILSKKTLDRKSKGKENKLGGGKIHKGELR